MTQALFRDDAYLKTAEAQVIAHDLGDQPGVILDRSIFYPTGGGQPGDIGHLTWDGGRCDVVDSRKGEGDQIILRLGPEADVPPVGVQITQHLNWDRRYLHMRMHSALHLLSVVIPLPVTGGQIGAEKSRLDFDMPEPPEDKEALQEALNALIARDLEITDSWITDAELDANPSLVKTMSVSPPRGAGRVRLVRMGLGEEQIDLQPCGGTHVARSAEIGRIRIGKIEKKSRQNRRVALHLE